MLGRSAVAWQGLLRSGRNLGLHFLAGPARQTYLRGEILQEVSVRWTISPRSPPRSAACSSGSPRRSCGCSTAASPAFRPLPAMRFPVGRGDALWRLVFLAGLPLGAWLGFVLRAAAVQRDPGDAADHRPRSAGPGQRRPAGRHRHPARPTAAPPATASAACRACRRAHSSPSAPSWRAPSSPSSS